jgi:hypothetical protein
MRPKKERDCLFAGQTCPFPKKSWKLIESLVPTGNLIRLAAAANRTTFAPSDRLLGLPAAHQAVSRQGIASAPWTRRRMCEPSAVTGASHAYLRGELLQGGDSILG